jgi:hypothetical protein
MKINGKNVPIYIKQNLKRPLSLVSGPEPKPNPYAGYSTTLTFNATPMYVEFDGRYALTVNNISYVGRQLVTVDDKWVIQQQFLNPDNDTQNARNLNYIYKWNDTNYTIKNCNGCETTITFAMYHKFTYWWPYYEREINASSSGILPSDQWLYNNYQIPVYFNVYALLAYPVTLHPDLKITITVEPK